MDWSGIVGTIISSLAMAGLFYIGGTGAAAQQEKTKVGTYLLRPNKLYYYLGLFSCSLVVIAIAATLYFDPSQVLFAIAATVPIFGIPGGYLVFFYRNCWLEFDEEIISTGTLFGKIKRVRWDEIEDISFGKISGYIKVKSAKELLKIHFHTVGLIHFLKMIEDRTDFHPKDLNLPI